MFALHQVTGRKNKPVPVDVSLKISGSTIAQQDPRVFVDTDHIEKCCHQTWYITKLDMTTFGLTHGDPVEDTSCGGKVDPYQPRTRNYQPIGPRQTGLQSVQGLRRITQNLAAKFNHAS
jgi:hypothetical protein